MQGLADDFEFSLDGPPEPSVRRVLLERVAGAALADTLAGLVRVQQQLLLVSLAPSKAGISAD